MSDDFFFEDEKELEEADAKSPKGEKGAKGKKEKPAKAAAAKTVAKGKGVSTASAGAGFEFSTIVVVLIAVIALLVGFLLGILLGNSLTAPTTSTMPPAGQGTIDMGGMGGGNAPELSDEQMQQGMPAGHPQVGGDEGGADAPAEGQDEAAPGTEGTGGE